MWMLKVVSMLYLLAVGICSAELDVTCTSHSSCDLKLHLICKHAYSSGDECMTGGKCKCYIGYHAIGDKCFPKSFIGDICGTDEGCARDVPGTTCFYNVARGTRRCICPHETSSKFLCTDIATHKKIGEACSSDTDTCYYEYEDALKTDATCKDFVCVCPANTRAIRFDCRPIKIGDACDAATECPLKAVCTSNSCVCDTGYSPFADKTACVKDSGTVAAGGACVIADHTCQEGLTCVDCDDRGSPVCGQVKGLLGDACFGSYDCHSHASYCSGTCVCMIGYRPFATIACLPLDLDMTCTTHYECRIFNADSYCQRLYSSVTCNTGAVCKCQPGFIAVSLACLKAQYIGDTCASNDYCSDTVPNTVCTADSICTCPSATHESISKYTCVATATHKKIGEDCTSGTHTCYYEYEAMLKTDAACTSSICVCPAHTKAYGITCIRIKITDKCTADTECPMKASCTSGTCSCDTSYTASDDNIACNFDTDPLTENAVCEAGAHQCTYPLECVACSSSPDILSCSQKQGLLGDECVEDGDCNINVARCIKGKCACSAGYTPYGRSACLPSGNTGSVCWSNAECTESVNDACIKNVCTPCPPKTFATTTGCMPTLNGPCTATSECTGTPNLFCYRKYSSGGACVKLQLCKCKKGFIEKADACVAAQYIGDTCTTDNCAATVGNSECDVGTTKCVCRSTYTAISKYSCAMTASKKIGEECNDKDICYYEYEATLKNDAICNTKCICPAKMKAFGSTCIPVRIGEACTRSGCPLKSSCIGTMGVCACQLGYTATSDNIGCVITSIQIEENGLCTVGELKCTEPLTCGPCVDMPGQPACGLETGLIGATCEIDSDCSNNVSVCTGSPLKCECAPGYTAHGIRACIPSRGVGSVCLVDGDCTAMGTVCTAFVCACDATHVMEGTTCIKGCTAANEATECPVAENKECDTTTRKCRCKAPAVTLGVTTPLTCTPGIMNSNCIDNSHCQNLENSACSGGKCGCASGFKSANNKCAKSGAGIKAAWMPIVILSGLIPVLYMIIC